MKQATVEEDEEEEEAAAEGTAERDGGSGAVDGVTEDARRVTEKAPEINNSHVKDAAAGQETSIRSEEMVAERQRTAATREQRITDDKGMLGKRGRKSVNEKKILQPHRRIAWQTQCKISASGRIPQTFRYRQQLESVPNTPKEGSLRADRSEPN